MIFSYINTYVIVCIILRKIYLVCTIYGNNIIHKKIYINESSFSIGMIPSIAWNMTSTKSSVVVFKNVVRNTVFFQSILTFVLFNKRNNQFWQCSGISLVQRFEFWTEPKFQLFLFGSSKLHYTTLNKMNWYSKTEINKLQNINYDSKWLQYFALFTTSQKHSPCYYPLPGIIHFVRTIR